VRILLWQGHSLDDVAEGATDTSMLAQAWREAGHDVTLISADEGAPLSVKRIHERTPAELETWVEGNARRVREHVPADLVFCQHILLGGPVGVAVSVATGVPFVVQAHDVELEHAMRGHLHLARWGRDALSHKNARAVFVTSPETRKLLLDICGGVRAPLHEIARGVDTDAWQPASRDEARAALISECERDGPNGGASYDARLPDAGNASRLRAFLHGDRRTLVYAGALTRSSSSGSSGSNSSGSSSSSSGSSGSSKGVHVLLEALHDVEARAVIVGFGDDRASLASLASECAPDRVLFTGALEQRHLKHLLAFADACVVPSVSREPFALVAAQAAAAGCPPLVARQAGLVDIAAGLEREYPADLRHLAAFRPHDVEDLRKKLAELLALRDGEERAVRNGARAAAVRHWSWANVAQRMLAAAVAVA
jgi:glycosyltransferase involved in cell wall biosynthesis